MRTRSLTLFSSLFFGILLALGASAGTAQADVRNTEVRGAGLTIVLASQNNNTVQVNVSSATGSPLEQPEIFLLNNPPRAVVDLPGFLSKGLVVKPVNHDWVSAVRFGPHPDRTRVVLDLKADGSLNKTASSTAPFLFQLAFHGKPAPAAAPVAPAAAPSEPDEYKGPLNQLSSQRIEPPVDVVEEDADEVELVTAKKEAPAKRLPDLEPVYPEGTALDLINEEIGNPPPKEPKDIQPQASAKAAVTEKPKAVAAKGNATESRAQLNTVSAKSFERRVPPPLPSNDQDNQGFLSTVNGIFFRLFEPGSVPGILIDAPGLQNYWFSQRDSRLFEIVLEKARLNGAHLGLPQFPPENFQGFEVVNAEQRGSDVLVRVYVGTSYRIAPVKKDGQLWVKISQ